MPLPDLDVSWTSHELLLLSSRHPCERESCFGVASPSCNTGVPRAMTMPKALLPQTRPNLLAHQHSQPQVRGQGAGELPQILNVHKPNPAAPGAKS